jgi:hypothetical protein
MKAALLLGVPVLMVTFLQSDSCSASRTTAGVQRPAVLASGTWGANHLNLEVSNNEITLQFDCAQGSIKPPIRLKDGRFDVVGTYTPESHGPTRKDGPAPREARYSGELTGEKLDLTVRLVRPVETIGHYNLAHGKQGKLWKCY